MMNPEREFLLTAFSCYLDQLLEENKLLEHKVTELENKVTELDIDYEILRIELEEEQKKNLSKISSTSGSIELPHFITSTLYRY